MVVLLMARTLFGKLAPCFYTNQYSMSDMVNMTLNAFIFQKMFLVPILGCDDLGGQSQWTHSASPTFGKAA